jgi:hypothetical protein
VYSVVYRYNHYSVGYKILGKITLHNPL